MTSQTGQLSGIVSTLAWEIARHQAPYAAAEPVGGVRVQYQMADGSRREGSGRTSTSAAHALKDAIARHMMGLD